jgi:hypothetical protein
VSVEVDLIELPRLDFHDLDLLQVLFVVNTVAQNVSECAECAFQSVRGCLFLCLLEGCCFAFAVLDGAVADVLITLEGTKGKESAITSWKVPSFNVIRTTIDSPRLTLPFCGFSSTFDHQHAPAYIPAACNLHSQLAPVSANWTSH